MTYSSHYRRLKDTVALVGARISELKPKAQEGVVDEDEDGWDVVSVKEADEAYGEWVSIDRTDSLRQADAPALARGVDDAMRHGIGGGPPPANKPQQQQQQQRGRSSRAVPRPEPYGRDAPPRREHQTMGEVMAELAAQREAARRERDRARAMRDRERAERRRDRFVDVDLGPVEGEAVRVVDKADKVNKADKAKKGSRGIRRTWPQV
ncbi:hypothetical protein F4819DRAFT_487626 [Hypoxylon fuscum]|nr:hypothetical protein F4819DRAFT_487626 [Hypoxylon fuscum]